MSRSNAGFTLIELLVVVSIMLVMLGGGIAAFISFNEKQQVTGVAKEVQLRLREAQTLARVGEKPSGCAKLLAYQVESQNNGTEVQVTADCDPDDVPYSTYQLPAGIKVIDYFSMRFLVLHGGVAGADSITISNDQTNYSYSFAVTQGGEITDGALE